MLRINSITLRYFVGYGDFIILWAEEETFDTIL